MQREFIASAFLAAALIAASVHGASPAGPAVGKLMTFKDWTVGCDNGLACQAVALMPEGGADQPLSVVVKRASGVAAPFTIELAGAQSKATSYRILIDGRIAFNGAIKQDSDFVMLSGTEAMKFARAMTRGKIVEMIDSIGAKIGSASLSGTSAALRYMDAQQGRAGSAGAIIATGKKRATARKAVIPVITAKKIALSKVLPETSAMVALSESSPCAAERFGSTEDTAYSLGNGPNGAQALVMLNCGAGAYNFSSGIYIGQRDAKGKWSFAPATFDYGAAGFSEESKIPLLVNADWDAATQTIASFAKGRGLGDCGSSESWIWDGASFRLTSATAMGECRGSLDWIPIWRAEARLVP
jgi:Protein of unknown function (DUF1176)